jgi:flagellar assembly factor FliW
VENNIFEKSEKYEFGVELACSVNIVIKGLCLGFNEEKNMFIFSSDNVEFPFFATNEEGRMELYPAVTGNFTI